MFRGRIRTTTYLYEDPAHPDRVTGAITTPEWTEDDRALLLALAQYEAKHCPGCGEPKEIAWHDSAAGEYEGVQWICHACTARDDGKPAVYSAVTARPLERDVATFPPFQIGLTTTEPPREGAG